MMGNKTLIAYTTQNGATEKTAQKMAEVLKAKYGIEADLVRLRKQSGAKSMLKNKSEKLKTPAQRFNH